MSQLNPPTEQQVRNWKSKAKEFENVLEFFAETYPEELLDLIGSDKCVEHFDLKLVREECWKDIRDRRENS